MGRYIMRTVLSISVWSRALSYMSIVTPRRAETLDASSSRRELFCLLRAWWVSIRIRGFISCIEDGIAA
jgi:hypothetical protein